MNGKGNTVNAKRPTHPAVVLAGLLTATALTPLHAQDSPAKTPADMAVAARISTLGLGLEVSKQVNPNLAARLGFNTYSYSHDFTSSDITYGGHLKLQSIAALADLYPAQHSAFHVTAGLLINNNKLSGTGRANGQGQFTINGHTYSAGDVGTLNGSVTFPNKIAPYLGIGFGKPAGGGSQLQLLADIGVVFQGKPRLSLSATNPGNNPSLTSDVNAQREQSQHDVNKFNLYPVVSLGLAYHF